MDFRFFLHPLAAILMTYAAVGLQAQDGGGRRQADGPTKAERIRYWLANQDEDGDGKISRDIVNKLWHIAARTDSRIEPIPCGEIQWEQNRSDAIIEIARTEGTSITA